MENQPRTHNNRMPQDARISQHKIGGVYDSIAPLYDIWGKLTESRARDRALELADIRDGQNILEVAVGTGIAFLEIVKQNPSGTNTGIDLSPGMLKKATHRLQPLSHHNYTISIGTAFQLEQTDNSVDTLVNNYMFDLIPFVDMDKVIIEFKRVLKPGGKLVLVNMTQGEKFGSHIYERIYRISPRTMGGCRGVELSNKLFTHGFTIHSREYYQQMLFPSEVILAEK
ncbi:MAG: class I SAM-dependent methyltransferase [Candidatus Marinimicrobia bacterium]|nr:class I SAM-dependent methyltransferase [Candidatus Neomarinimicrobiota bacterium]